MTQSNILIIEDDWFTAEDTKGKLENLGYMVPGIVPSGEEAIKMIKEYNPDLVLMDIVLKGEMDGIEAAEHIKAKFSIPIVYVTAHADKELMERAKITEPFGYITKPFETAELHTAIEIALYKHKIENKLKENEFYQIKAQEIGKLGHFSLDPVSNLVEGSPELFRIFDVDRDRPLFEAFANAVHPEDGHLIFPFIDRAVQEGAPYNVEHRVRHKNGDVLNVHAKGQIINKSSGKRLVGIVQDITDLRQSEEALRESEEKYRQLFNTVSDAIMLFDAETKEFFDVNEAALKMYGYTRNEFLNLRHSNITAEQEESDKSIKQVLADELTRIPLRIHRKKDGTLFPVEISSGKLELGGRTVLCGVIRDITERKRAEEELRESEVNLAKAQRIAHIGNWSWNIKEDRVSWSNEYYRIVGLSPQEFEANYEAYLDCIHPNDLDYFKSFTEKALKEKKPWSFEYRIVRPDNEVRIIHEKGEITVDMNGNPISFFGTAQDITKRKQAEEELKWRTELNQTLLDALPCVALLLKPSTREVVASNKAGREAGAIPGTTCYGTWGQRTDPCPWCLAPKVWEKDGPQHIEIGAVGLFWDAHWFPIDEDLYLHYAFDISEKKKMEGQLQQSQKMEAIGTLAGGIAHDFNNILSPIMIHSEMAKMELPSDSPVQHNLKEILKAGGRARDMVKQILIFSRKKEGERVEIKIVPVLKEVLKLLRSTMPTTIDIQQNLEAESGMVLADPTQIHQIMLNLGTNAAHSMRDKGGTLKVSLIQEDLDSEAAAQYTDLNAGSYLKLIVSDTGSGIDTETMERIFEPYFTTKEVGEGTGMGLALIHGIVKNYGGDITVASEPAKGTTFNVYLPRVEADLAPVETQSAKLPRGTERILFVDDEKVAVNAIQPMLENLGYDVTARTSSIEALEAFRNSPERFDLVITDMTMPNMTGVELTNEIMKIHPNIPIILCTGFSEQIGEKRAKAMGISFLMKPIVMGEMAHTIREVLDKN